MAAYLTLWWVWICIALAFGVVELLAPTFFFLGFAIGAFLMAGIVSVLPLTNVAAMLALYAVLSLLSWLVVKAVFRKQSSGARIVTRDINEN